MLVTVTGANGLVGAAICRALSERGATVRAIVRRPGVAPTGPGVEEHVGDFTDPAFAAAVVADADAVVTTVYPLNSDDADEQRQASVDGTTSFSRAAAAAGVARHVHLSTAGVYDRSPGVGDVDESGALVPDDAYDYGVIKRDTDTALADVEGITRVLLRPPAILGPGSSSVWNQITPAHLRDDETARHVAPDKTFAWIHVDDLAALAADLATGAVAPSDDPARGPVAAGCTPLNVAAGPATARDYYGTVADALGFEMTWDDEPAWTGRLRADRARGWGWRPAVDLPTALAELADGLVSRTA